MPPKKEPKTSEDYEAEIRVLYREVQLLKAFCESNPEDLNTAKELDSKKASLRDRRDKWAATKDIIVYVDGREQLPNSAEELKCKTERTPQYDKKKWPYKSVGDYTAFVPGIGWYPVCRERKEIGDADHTLRDKDHRKNLYEEFDRFLIDSRFTIFRFDLECTEDELYNYVPPVPKTCKFCKVSRVKMDTGDYICPKTYSIFPEFNPGSDFKCHDGFEERPRNNVNLKAMRTLRQRMIRQCFEKGMQIIFRGSREGAYTAYRKGIEEWLILNYVAFLKLEDKPIDEAVLKERLARLEIDIKNTRQALGVAC